MTRFAMLPVLALLLPPAALAQAPEAQPAPAATPRPPRPQPPAANPFAGSQRLTTLREPLGIAPAPLPGGARPDLAPTPNRDIEAPRDRVADNRSATLEPMILPPERRTGMTFGREHLRDTGTTDKPFDMFLPGARLRIPFEGNR